MGGVLAIYEVHSSLWSVNDMLNTSHKVFLPRFWKRVSTPGGSLQPDAVASTTGLEGGRAGLLQDTFVWQAELLDGGPEARVGLPRTAQSQAGGRGDRGSRPMDKALAIAWACILIVLVLFAALYLPWS